MTDRYERAMEALASRVADLEQRLERLEGGARRVGGARGEPAREAVRLSGAGWTTPYEVAELEASETWIELHEVSARPQLQRLIRQVVQIEGPVTDRLVLDRVRRAWGLKRAGGRVAEAFDQAVRQLLARGLVERRGDALASPGAVLAKVRVPSGDDQTKRGADDVPMEELRLAIRSAAVEVGSAGEDEVTMAVAKTFGWTRRGGAIQERLDAALELAVSGGDVRRDAGRVLPGAAES